MPRPFSTSDPLTKSIWLEGFLLLLITPIFVFPNRLPILTAVSLSLLAIFYIIRPPKSSPFNISWLIWWLLVGVAVLVTADPELTLPKFTGLVLGFAWWVFLSRAINGRSSLILGFIFWGVLGLGFAAIGVLSTNWLFKIPGISTILQVLPSQILQLPGSAAGVQPNQLAGTLLIYFPFLLSLLIGWRPSTHRKLLLAGTAVLTLFTTTILLLTQSRSGWIGAIGGVFVLFILWGVILPRSRQRWLLWGAVGAILLVGILGLFAIGPERIQTIWEDPARSEETAVGNFSTIGYRQEVWRWGLMAATDFAFTGTGLGTFRQVVTRLYPLGISIDIGHAHNIFLQTALDIGIPGLITYLSILLVSVVIGWQTAKRNETYRPFALGILASFAALHIYGLTDALALGSKTGLSFWMALGLLTAMFQLTQVTTATNEDQLPDSDSTLSKSSNAVPS